jgi:hypothetical protein
MAPRGRPPKPVEQHRRTGTFNAGKHNRGPLVAVAEVDQAPHDKSPADLFTEIMDAGSAWFARTDGIQLSMLRESLEERARLVPVAESSTEARKQLRELNREIADWLTALGFNPTARARLGLAEVKAASTLEKLQAKRDKS